MAIFVVDTHALIWFVAGDPKLGRKAKMAMEKAGSRLVVPSIALAETLWIVKSRQTGVSPRDLLSAVDADPQIEVSPLTREIVERAHFLEPDLEMHDRQIVATAHCLTTEAEPVALLTKDESVVSSGLLTCVW